jgi:hypothetical protein
MPDVCESLFWRLSQLKIGDLLPVETMLRMPIALQNETNDFLAKWSFAGQEMIADDRAGFLRFFKNRTVVRYRRKLGEQFQ